MKPEVHFSWIKGVTYREAWDHQTDLLKGLVAEKISDKGRTSRAEGKFYQHHRLLFCEHSPVFTLGKSGSMDHLLLSDSELTAGGIEFFKINRGGDITYHGPGQITGYPVFDLEEFFTDVHRYVFSLEESVIRLMALYGLKGIRMPGYTGVWMEPDESSEKYRKICAIGVHMSRWVTMHGFAFNVNTDLSYFDKIVPCGIVDENKTVTSMARELGYELDYQRVGEKLAESMAEVFGFDLFMDQQ